ncbi:MAG TPA: zinc ribbon domain-containing protein [Gammaproteobacteria bacterium]
MPIYEYACNSCGHRLEAMQKMSDPLLSECPACGKAALVKQMSAAGAFVVKEGRKGSSAAPACGAGGCGGGACALNR